MKKVAIFGSTGMTGLCATAAALNKGLKVNVLVRNASRLPDHLKNQVQVYEGNVLSYSDVGRTLQGVDGVIVALGTGNDLKSTTDLSNGLKHIINAMKDANIEVISVCLSAFLFFDVNSEKVPIEYREITAEHKRMLEVLKESGLKYVAVFAPRIVDAPATSYQVEHEKYLGRIVSKHDLGQFLVDSLSQSQHHGQICGIISK